MAHENNEFAAYENEEPSTLLISAKEESLGIMINLSFGSDAQIGSFVKAGCI